MPGPGKGMDAVNSSTRREFDSILRLPLLLSNGMDAVKSPNPNGC